MKKTIAAMAVCLLPALGFAQRSVTDEIKASGEGSVIFEMNGSIGNMIRPWVDKVDDDGIRDVLAQMRSVRIMTLARNARDEAGEGMRRLKSLLQRRSFEELLSVHADSTQIHLMMKGSRRNPGEMVLLVDDGPDGLLAVDLTAE